MLPILVIALGAFVGYLIGTLKERPVAGLLLGLFLNWLGIIIIGLVPHKHHGQGAIHRTA